MNSAALLHLTTPAEWRAALTAGVLTPPSLAEVGFVHLSTPEQVHLPAERLFAGRRDVVLLVVDPARLTDPVRLEPGVPGDPAGMRFPHLYGPLPTAAVVAVVPWLLGATSALPEPADAAARARALAVSLPVRRAAEWRDVGGGIAVRDPAGHPRENRVLVTDDLDADAIVALTDEAAAGWPAPIATLLHPDAGPAADELAHRGWHVAVTLVLAHRGPFPTVRADLAQVAVRPAGREDRTDRVVQVLDLAVRAHPGSVLQLRVDGGTAAVAPGPTDARYADALLTAALEHAGAAGCDLVLVDAAEPDRPWYGRRGFEVVGRTFDVVGPGQTGATTDRIR